MKTYVIETIDNQTDVLGNETIQANSEKEALAILEKKHNFNVFVRSIYEKKEIKESGLLSHINSITKRVFKSDIKETISQLLPEITDMDETELDLVGVAIEKGLISDETPEAAEMLDALENTGAVDDSNWEQLKKMDPEDKGILAASYVKYILAPQALDALKTDQMSKRTTRESIGESHRRLKESISSEDLALIDDKMETALQDTQMKDVAVSAVMSTLPREKIAGKESAYRAAVIRSYDSMKESIGSKRNSHKVMELKKKGIELRLVRKASTDEWVVKYYENGKYNEDKSYYTDDKEDAIRTMKDMQKRIDARAKGYRLKEEIEKDYAILAQNIADEQTAKRIAQEKKGRVIADEKDDKKFMVVQKVEESKKKVTEGMESEDWKFTSEVSVDLTIKGAEEFELLTEKVSIPFKIDCNIKNNGIKGIDIVFDSSVTIEYTLNEEKKEIKVELNKVDIDWVEGSGIYADGLDLYISPEGKILTATVVMVFWNPNK